VSPKQTDDMSWLDSSTSAQTIQAYKRIVRDTSRDSSVNKAPMWAIARKAASVGGSLQAKARPTQQREAGQVAGKPQLPRRFFSGFNRRVNVDAIYLYRAFKAQMTFGNSGEVEGSAEALGGSDSLSISSRL
jgi:hypothetical protein